MPFSTSVPSHRLRIGGWPQCGGRYRFTMQTGQTFAGRVIVNRDYEIGAAFGAGRLIIPTLAARPECGQFVRSRRSICQPLG